MKDCEALASGETDFPKDIYERRHFRRAQFGGGVPHVQQGPMDSAALAGLREIGENRATGREVKFALSTHADEFSRSYNL